MTAPIIVESVPHLRQLINDGHHEFYIVLNGGLISRKLIWIAKDESSFKIENSIDGSTQTLTETGLMNQKLTNIGRAIKNRTFICEE